MPGGAVGKIRRGAADTSGKPSKPHVPPKGQTQVPKNKGAQVGVKG